jgi:hypothetical protein
MSTCRSCGAEVVWAATVKGRRIPLDAQPVADGNMTLVDGIAHLLLQEPLEQQVRYRTHFSTCPNAESHRRPR